MSGATEESGYCAAVAEVPAAARLLKDNGAIVSMNLLPFEPLDSVTNPADLHLGVQEMTWIGMKEIEMEENAGFFKKVLIDKKLVT